MKIRIAVVDDELTSRNTIKRMLESNGTYEVVADFSEAKAALEWIRSNEIDILLCDMQMPEVDGIELMRMVRVIWPFLPIIVISSYADFDYVRGSLVNGAANYLLKHEMTEDKLLGVLESVRIKYRIEPKEKTISFKSGWCTHDSESFRADNIIHMTETKQIDFCCRNTLALAISPDFTISERTGASEYKRDICKALIDIIRQGLGQEYKYVVYHTNNNHLILILSFVNTTSTFYVLNIVQNLTSRVSRQAIRMLDTTLTLITGDLHMELDTSVREALYMEKLLEDKLYLGGNRITAVAVTEKMPLKNMQIPASYVRIIQFEVENDLDSVIETVQELFKTIEKERYDLNSVKKACQTLIELMPASDEEKKKTESKVMELEILEQFRGCILDFVRETVLFARKKNEPFSPMITRIVNYMRKNYDKDISLEKCIELVGTSYSHLSREFKKETGMRFVEYLNRLRVTKAKCLLMRHDLSMKEIVECTGFRNYNYFFKVFKEFEGMTPSEFAAKN